LLAAWITWPALLPSLFRKLAASTMTWGLLIGAPTEYGVPRLATISFLVILIVAFFLGAFKANSEPISANWFHVRNLRFFLRHGRTKKYLDEFYKLTELEVFETAATIEKTKPLEKDGEDEFRTLFERQSRMITSRVYRSLANRRSPPRAIFELKRNVVAALYAYAEHPLHPDVPFFTDFPKLKLPSYFEIYQDLGDKVRLDPKSEEGLTPQKQIILEALRDELGRPSLSLEDMERFSPEEQWNAILFLRRQGLMPDDWRREEMEHRKAELAMAVLRDDTYAVPVYLALMSRNLLGLAFDPNINNTDNPNEAEMLRVVTRASVERMSRMAPQLYDSYGKYSRFAYMGFPIHYAIQDIARQRPKHTGDIEEAFTPVLSERETDISLPEARQFLSEKQNKQVYSLVNKLDELKLWAPGVAMAIKRWKLMRLVTDPTDKLALFLMLKRADPNNLPLERRPYLNKAADALSNIFKLRLFDKSEVDLDSLIDRPDFSVFRKLFEINGMTAENGKDIKSYMVRYMRAKDDVSRRAVLLDCLSQITLTEGLTNGFIFQQSRRLLKSEPKAYEQFARRLAGTHLDDPTLYPSYLLDRFLQDEKLLPTTEFASLVLVEDLAHQTRDALIDLTPARGPKFYGKDDLVQEAANDLNLRQATINMQGDAASTDGNVYRVAISRSLLFYAIEIFRRIPSRVTNGAARQMHPVLLKQIQRWLRTPAKHIRKIFLSPELLTQQLVTDDPEIKDSDITLVPNPFYTTAFEILLWQSPLMREEREAYLSAVEREHGPASVAELLNKIDYLNYLVRSTGVNIEYVKERFVYRDGQRIDLLDHKRPPESFNTGCFFRVGVDEARASKTVSKSTTSTGTFGWMRRRSA